MSARRAAEPRRVSNVVFMGMGEPLANYDNVWAAVTRLHDDVGISARHLTISTVGIVPGIRRLAAESLPVNLAVSLHAANDRLRDELIPVNRRYPLDLLAQACSEYVEATGRRLSFEWALIDGVNDRSADAAELATFARPLRAHVNLIPLNPTPGYLVRGTPPRGVRAFRDELDRYGVNVTVRVNRGTEIQAACGQLAGGGDLQAKRRGPRSEGSTPVSAPRRRVSEAKRPALMDNAPRPTD
jgi:23S rRNA (adenine2503-C2)-methyltransferase